MDVQPGHRHRAGEVEVDHEVYCPPGDRAVAAAGGVDGDGGCRSSSEPNHRRHLLRRGHRDCGGQRLSQLGDLTANDATGIDGRVEVDVEPGRVVDQPLQGWEVDPEDGQIHRAI